MIASTLFASLAATCILVWAMTWAKRRSRPMRGPSSSGQAPREDKLVFVYVAGSSGLRRLREQLASEGGWWKVGCVGVRGGDPNTLLAHRMRMLKGYGAVVRTKTGFVEQPGFDEWHLQSLARYSVPRRDISVRPNFIEVRLPNTLSFGMFDARLRGALCDRSLHDHLDVRNTDCGSRFSCVEGRHVLQTEIVRLRPHLSEDVAYLCKIIGEIIDGRGRGDGAGDGSDRGRSVRAAAEPPRSAAARAARSKRRTHPKASSCRSRGIR